MTIALSIAIMLLAVGQIATLKHLRKARKDIAALGDIVRAAKAGDA